jgi:outer membrane protein TolC
MKQLIILTILFSLLGPVLMPVQSSAKEQEALVEIEAMLSEDLDLSDLLEYAYRSNPSITASKESWQAFIENYRIGKSYPDPQLMTTYFPKPIETRLGPQDWNLVIAQPIPFPGKLKKAGDMEAVGAGIARLNLDRVVRKIHADLAASFHELLYIQKARETAEKSAGLLEELRKIGETAHAGDRATLLDVVKAQSRVGQVRYDILLLDELEQREKSRINGILDRLPDAPLGKAGFTGVNPTNYTLAEIYTLAEKNNEAIRMAELAVEKAALGTELAGLTNRPNFKVGLFYAAIGDPDVPSPPADAGDDAVGIQFGMSIPLWAGKNSGRVARARAMENKARAVRSARVNSVRTRISNLWFKLKNAERLITLYRDDLIPQAMGSLTTAETWFREGEGSFSDFVETQNTLYNFQLSLARAAADHGKTLARLEQLAGAPLTGNTAEAAGKEEK